tara:strand:- start:636 stop:866 length:231 start_codon:yes stop_codon:yes gene_type:complete
MTETATDLRYQLYRLDQAIFQLLDERAGLTVEIGAPPEIAVDDLLARHQGKLNAQELNTIADAIHKACKQHLERVQ